MLYRGGHKVGTGTYWNVMNGRRVELKEAGILPGEERAIYIKAPGIVVLLAAPILGLIFAIFLPFIGIAMTVTLATKKIATSTANAAAKSFSFGWRPVEAYLAGKKRKKVAKDRKKHEK